MEEEKRIADLRVRLTNEEMTRLKKKAKTCNLTVSKFVRYVILKKIENGISQLNHHLANGGRIENETSNKISQLITSIDKRINQIEDVIKEVYKWG